jgi:hypothetical protein
MECIAMPHLPNWRSAPRACWFSTNPSCRSDYCRSRSAAPQEFPTAGQTTDGRWGHIWTLWGERKMGDTPFHPHLLYVHHVPHEICCLRVYPPFSGIYI